jgi:hypothetical protein
VVESFAVWLKSTKLSWFVIHYPWVWPASETLHFIGLALLVGIVGTIDLRMLGMAKNMPFRPLHRLLPWAIAGFAINLMTGILFFAGDPFQYIHNPAFQLKLLFILLAGLNVLVFYLTTFKSIQDLEPGEDAPLRAKVVAATSLFLWIGVMVWGRMLPFIGNAF